MIRRVGRQTQPSREPEPEQDNRGATGLARDSRGQDQLPAQELAVT
jgi:hypothetical protein